MSLQATTWQTVGPYFRIGLEYLNTTELAPAGTPGEPVTVVGKVLDGNGKPISDALIEIWQADASGEYGGIVSNPADGAATAFSGFGRIPTDDDGRFSFSTIKPGPVAGPAGTMQSPHLAIRLMMRGLLRGLTTRMYFPSEAVDSDPILELVPATRRATLMATVTPGSPSTLQWNIEMQGERETVFFDC